MNLAASTAATWPTPWPSISATVNPVEMRIRSFSRSRGGEEELDQGGLDLELRVAERHRALIGGDGSGEGRLQAGAAEGEVGGGLGGDDVVADDDLPVRAGVDVEAQSAEGRVGD